MGNKGFISIALILTTIILATAIIFVMIDTHEQNSNLNENISRSIQQRSTLFKEPICVWIPPSTPVLPGVSRTFEIRCTHFDGIVNPITPLAPNAPGFIRIEPSIGTTITFNNQTTIPNGVSLSYNITFTSPGTYTLILPEGRIRVNVGEQNQNSIVRSNPVCVGNC